VTATFAASTISRRGTAVNVSRIWPVGAVFGGYRDDAEDADRQRRIRQPAGEDPGGPLACHPVLSAHSS
jgi:hypothetical protein